MATTNGNYGLWEVKLFIGFPFVFYLSVCKVPSAGEKKSHFIFKIFVFPPLGLLSPRAAAPFAPLLWLPLCRNWNFSLYSQAQNSSLSHRAFFF